MLRSAVERTVVVQAGAQGSGVLLSPRLVLTCAHVLRDQEWIRTVHPESERPIPSRAIWRDERLDVALLLTGEDLVAPEQWALARLRWGTLTTTDPLPGCQVVGFPAVQRYGAAGHLEYDQLTGTVLPMAGRLRSSLVCEFDRAVVAPPTGGSSPLAGLSGSPLFAGAVLLGVVTEVPDGRDHRRVEAAPVDRILDAPGFPRRVTGTEHSHVPPVLEPLTGFHQRDELFEQHYARALQTRYRKTEIFGIDELGTTETSWDLDTAYLSLEAVSASRRSEQRTEGAQPYEGERPARRSSGPLTHAGPQAYAAPQASPAMPPEPDPESVPVPRRVNDLLADRPRTVLRGEAGAGKTTLVWWLASHAACGALGHELAELNDLVPFVVPMRSLHTLGSAFPTPEQLPAAAELQIGSVPDGWPQRVLESGRALLLVDGMDEIPPPRREEARRRLGDLLAMYPHNRCLVTVRPLAVPSGWLATEHFEELRLLPMRDSDVLAFSKAWHAAARLECAGFRDEHRAAAEDAQLRSLEQDLAKELARNPTLRNLARTPLLAAVICALHRRRRGFLPESRWSLYNAALTMLLGGRDTLRRVNDPEGITLGVEEHHQVLQRIAVWLARGGYVEFNHAQAEHQIDLAMRGMPQVRQQGSPKDILTHLLNRSGLLQERNETVVQFIHRTFQDYLAAKELQESDGLGELLQHAGDEQWQDIILLAVGHGNRGEVRRLVEGLTEKGDRAAEQGQKAGGDIHVLAARCAQSAVVLDEEVRERTAERIRTLIPRIRSVGYEKLRSLGEYVLPLIPAPEELNASQAKAIAELLSDIGGPASLPLLRAFTRHESRGVRDVLCGVWPSYPADDYAREVLAHMDLTHEELRITEADMMRALCHCGPVGQLTFRAAIPDAELSAHLPRDRFHGIRMVDNPLLDGVFFLRHQSAVRSLVLRNCPDLKDLSALDGLPLTHLELDLRHLPKSALAPLRRLNRLSSLSLSGTLQDSDIPLPAGHRTVRTLSVTSETPVLINDLSGWASLTNLDLASACDIGTLLYAAARAPALSSLGFPTDSPRLPLPKIPWGSPGEKLTRLPRIHSLTLRAISQGGTALNLARVFPYLTRLTLECRGGTVLDLTPLRRHRGLVIRVNGRRVKPQVVTATDS
ncbi:NACHT domain-containing protein [Streptomyces phyllanthi]|uniref:NACHT domain-containing protein n=1 Tax=Streptomyces phyllanthi TaxID=1803180 RepID=A0A5N8WC48_9ACTN|nr:serine protease [Streptomyces phyllanthi]MPY43705.1 NACHT domain-containing protein [Streptomyces phyllanthi]